MSLIQYSKKRDLKKSGEPNSKIEKTSESKSKKKFSKNKKLISRFVIHKHYASHLHWDLRLEINGVLKSWAVPKKPSRSKGIKRLAIQVEDHPIEYAKFKGTIPKGNYGAGKVEIWDNGEYDLIEKTSKKIIFELYGKKLKGKYCLIKTNYQGKKSWLWFRV